MQLPHPSRLVVLGSCLAGLSVGCGSSSNPTWEGDGGSMGTGSGGSLGSSGSSSGGSTSSSGSGSGGSTSSGGSGSGGSTSSSGSSSGGSTSSGSSGGAGTMPSGWLFTNGNKIYVSNGSSSSVWMGRGMNVDDVFFCGYNGALWMTTPDQTAQSLAAALITGWKPNFFRVSLAMNSQATVTSWLTNPTQYKTPMTNVINSIGAHAGVYVLVTLRSDVTMIEQDTTDGDPEATGLPSDGTNSPNKTTYPTGTDAVYQAMVDTFAHANFVLFGLTNEPGGNKRSNATIVSAMSHAVGVIRAEEDKLGVPHHIVSVQGNSWTSDISFYSTTPLPYDNVVYEIHAYPPTASQYTYANIPVIVGEYGSLTTSTAPAFFADVETKKIPTLAWDADPFSDCAPDLLNVNQSATSLSPSAWGNIVMGYLTTHTN